MSRAEQNVRGFARGWKVSGHWLVTMKDAGSASLCKGRRLPLRRPTSNISLTDADADPEAEGAESLTMCPSTCQQPII